jgi:hypothetical protein
VKISEKKAKANLEKATGIEFDYSEAVYDESDKKYWFKIIIPNRKISQRFRTLAGLNIGSNTFIVSEPKDFEPYLTLANHLEIQFFDVFKYIYFDYGNDWKLGNGNGENVYCWTGKGWLEISVIEAEFFKRFKKHRRNISMKEEEWIVEIYSNCCRGISYRKSNKGEWTTAYECKLLLEDLQDKLIRVNSRKAVLKINSVKKNSAKKPTTKNTSTKKPVSKKVTMKKITSKKPTTTKKITVKKPVVKNITTKKPVKKKSVVKKSPVKKNITKKSLAVKKKY